MNLEKLNKIFELYKRDVDKINEGEGYKWEAIKCFQDNWDITATDFGGMLTASLALTGNLLASGQYFPRGMIIHFANEDSTTIKQLFEELYNEDVDLIERITTFSEKIEELNIKRGGNDKTYQDHRAILVYLCLKYPDRYFLYKFEMFKIFADIIDYPYKPIRGRTENIIQYLTLCNIIKEKITTNNSLVKIHKDSLGPIDLFDPALHILTQNVIYAATKYIKETDDIIDSTLNIELITKLYKPTKREPILKGRFVNHIENEREKKLKGDLGEFAILEYEQQQLKNWGIHDLKPIHTAKNSGDGLGYDILSYTKDRKEKFIEVKTSTSTVSTPFYITAPELKKSIEESENFYLYRLFDFKANKKSGKLLIIRGDLTGYCINPRVYLAVIEEDKGLGINNKLSL